jgi:hypothetical protein
MISLFVPPFTSGGFSELPSPPVILPIKLHEVIVIITDAKRNAEIFFAVSFNIVFSPNNVLFHYTIKKRKSKVKNKIPKKLDKGLFSSV